MSIRSESTQPDPRFEGVPLEEIPGHLYPDFLEYTLNRELATLSTSAAMERRAQEIQMEHEDKLYEIDRRYLEDSGEPQTPWELYHCAALDTGDARGWQEKDLVEYKKRCQWEQRIRIAMLTKDKCTFNWSKYPHVFDDYWYTKECERDASKSNEEIMLTTHRKAVHMAYDGDFSALETLIGSMKGTLDSEEARKQGDLQMRCGEPEGSLFRIQRTKKVLNIVAPTSDSKGRSRSQTRSKLLIKAPPPGSNKKCEYSPKQRLIHDNFHLPKPPEVPSTTIPMCITPNGTPNGGISPQDIKQASTEYGLHKTNNHGYSSPVPETSLSPRSRNNRQMRLAKLNKVSEGGSGDVVGDTLETYNSQVEVDSTLAPTYLPSNADDSTARLQALASESMYHQELASTTDRYIEPQKPPGWNVWKAPHLFSTRSSPSYHG